MSCIIKQVPADFIVKEKNTLSFNSGGPFTYYILKKQGYSTQKAVERIATTLRKRLKYINYAGNKDKYAVTEQYISILHGPKKDLKLGNIELRFIGRGKERINLGDHEGNEFEITIRGMNALPPVPKFVPNYYDIQRFGYNINNHIVGKMIIKKQYKEACETIPEIKKKLGESKDFVGALRSLPKRILRIYPHAYQSYLWNLIACKYIENFPHRKIPFPLGDLAIPDKELKNTNIPIPGYMMDATENTLLDSVIKQVLKSEDIKPEDFRQKRFPEFDLKGGIRPLFYEMRDFKMSPLTDDELNKGKKKCVVKFFLGPGSYATMVIRALCDNVSAFNASNIH